MKTRKYSEKCKALKERASLAIKTGSLFILLFLSVGLSAQDGSISISTSYDTVYIGNPVQIEYKYQNISCPHTMPEYPESWILRGGPNTSMMTRMTNGATTTEQKITYVFIPQELGKFTMEEIICQEATTGNLTIHVVNNPDEIEQQLPESKMPEPFLGRGAWDLNPSSPAPDEQEKQIEPIKPKRKTYKL